MSTAVSSLVDRLQKRLGASLQGEGAQSEDDKSEETSAGDTQMAPKDPSANGSHVDKGKSIESK